MTTPNALDTTGSTVGDHDPTNIDFPHGSDICDKELRDLHCTAVPEHAGPHVAGTGGGVVAVWQS